MASLTDLQCALRCGRAELSVTAPSRRLLCKHWLNKIRNGSLSLPLSRCLRPGRDYAKSLSPSRSLLCDGIKAETFVPVKPYPPQSRITEACETDTFSCRAVGDGGGQTRSTLRGHAGCAGGARSAAPTFGRQIAHIRLISKHNMDAEKLHPCVSAPYGLVSHWYTHPRTPNNPQYLSVWEVVPLVTS